jgi:MoxR-like ATPase
LAARLDDPVLDNRARNNVAAVTTSSELRERLFNAGYVADEDLADLLWMGLTLERPILIEGAAGVGKTAIAGASARALGRRLLRLQCYEGLDLSQSVYEWNYSRQLLEIRLAEAGQIDSTALRDTLFSERFLLERPLLQAIRCTEPCVLLIDEIDRADEAFEAFLLEMLSEYQVTVPELGTLVALSKPLVVLTSNGTRDLSDALRRRCLFHYLDFPSLARCRSYGRWYPMPARGWSRKPSPSCSACAARIWTRPRASPKRSTGCVCYSASVTPNCLQIHACWCRLWRRSSRRAMTAGS